MSFTIEDTIRHYQKIAKNFGASSASTMKDPYIRSQETEFFLGELAELPRGSRVLDAGCGNGHTLEQINLRYPYLKLEGIDLTPEFIQVAEAKKLPNCTWQSADLEDAKLGEYDAIISQRVLINILDRKKRERAISRLVQSLKPHGLLLMSESFREGLDNLNRALREVLLPEMKVGPHNRYLTESEIEHWCSSLGLREMSGKKSPQHLSTHFFTTRVLHPLLRPEGGRVLHTEMVRFFNLALGPGIGDYAPIQFRVFQKISQEDQWN